MGEKKKPGRFTLQFNLKDPKQQTVSALLEQQGRHKAQFITSAVLFYIQCPKPQENGKGPSAIDETALEQMMLAILEKHPRFVSVAPGELSKAEESPAQDAPTVMPWEDAMGNDAARAIADTLAAFQAG